MISSSAEYQAAISGNYRKIEVLAVVDISDPDMVYGEVVMDSSAPWSKPTELHDKVFDSPQRYATLEPGRWLLDGSFDIFPDDYKVSEHMGICNETMCGEDGSWPADKPAFFEQKISKVDVLQAMSIFFSSDPADGVALDFSVDVLYNGTSYFHKDFVDNELTEISISGFTVYTPDTIRVTVKRWSLPFRRMRVVDLIPGVYERWPGRVLTSFSCNMQGDFSNLSLPYGTLNITLDNRSKRFEPRRKDGLFQSIEERQGMEAYIGVRLASGAVERKKLGVFYQAGDGWKTSDNSATISWSMVDIIGLIANRTYFPPKTLPTTLEGWIASIVAQLGDNFKTKYHVDQNYVSKAITARSVDDVTGKKCGDILRWACMAAGVWPRADQETGYLTAEPLWNQGNKVLLRFLNSYPTMSANKTLAAIIFTLADGNSTEYVVSGNSTSSEETVSVSNPFIHTQQEALTAARLILSCYGGNMIETSSRGDPTSEIGDVDTIWLDESTATTARIQTQNYNITDGILKNCLTKMVQADGSYLFEEFAVIRESGKWKAPANVKNNQLRVVIGSGGQGGSRGQDGFVDGNWNTPGQGVTAGYGEKGLDGIGGKVWYGVININPEQEFDVMLGAGGAPSDTYGVPGAMGGVTTFGAYSSEDGELYPNGYTDIANGKVFARTGVTAPIDGTSDGGAGGEGGEPGEGYWYEAFDIHGNPVGWRFSITKQPGPGQPGVAGGSGFVMVTWDKLEE